MDRRIAFLLLLFIWSCHTSSTVEETVASDVILTYDEALEIEARIKPALTKCVAVKNILLKQPAPLNNSELHLVSEVEAIEKSYETWSAQQKILTLKVQALRTQDGKLTEDADNLEDLLRLQREFKDNISTIKKRLGHIIQNT